MPKDKTNENPEIKAEKTCEESCECKDDKNKDKKKIKEIEEQLTKLKSEVDHWKNEYYRAYADIKNLRASLEKEHTEAIKFRAMGFIEDLLPVLDSFHTALGNEPATLELKNYLVGFQFIYRNLVSVLENEGVVEVAPKLGDKFSANEMNAVETIETEGQENLVAKVYRNGYRLHNRLIRPAMVSVSKKKVNNPETNTNSAEKSDA